MLAPGLAAMMRAHAERAYPEECCGILLGHAREALESRACANTRAGERGRYAIAPQELIAAQREGRERNLEIVGFYHSHPDHPAEPSPTDAAEAYWEGCSYVIVSVVQRKAAELRSFRLACGALVAEVVE